MLSSRAHEQELLFIGERFHNAFASYYHATPEGQQHYPATLNDLLKDPRYAQTRRHLRKIEIDPFAGTNQWGLVTAPEGGIMGVHSLSTKKPIKVTGFLFEGLEHKQSYAEWIFFYSPDKELFSTNARHFP